VSAAGPRTTRYCSTLLSSTPGVSPCGPPGSAGTGGWPTLIPAVSRFISATRRQFPRPVNAPPDANAEVNPSFWDHIVCSGSILRLNDPHCFTRTTNPLAGTTAFSRACRREAGPRIVPRQDIDPDQEKSTICMPRASFRGHDLAAVVHDREGAFGPVSRDEAAAVCGRTRSPTAAGGASSPRDAWCIGIVGFRTKRHGRPGLVTDGNRRRPVGTGTDRARWLSRIRASSWD
jgi:hypothetical protein